MGVTLSYSGLGGKVKFSGTSGKFKTVYTKPLLLSLYPGAGAAYSLRKLSTTYTGSAIRVRRSSDSTEQDIGFVNDQLDTGSLNTFVGIQNLLASAQQFDNAIWTKLNSTAVTANATAAPDSTITADLITQATQINIYQDHNPPTTQTFVFSCYLKKSTQLTCDLYIFKTSVGFLSQATFNLDTGTITAQPFGTNAKIENVGNGWYRCSVTGVYNAAVTCGIYNTTSVYAWGAQLTNNGYQTYSATQSTNTGYITKWYDQSGNARNAEQSTTSLQPVIIAKDVKNQSCIYYISPNELRTLNDATFLSNTAYTAFVVENQSTIGTDRYFIGIDYTGGSANTIVGIGYRSTSQVSIAHYTNDANFTFTAVTAQKLNTAIFKNIGSDYYINSVSLGTSASPTSAVTINNKLQIGRLLGTGALYYNGNISEMIIYPSNQTSNRTGIETNINSYYSIY